MFSIVHFYKENSVEGVPSSWVKSTDSKTLCYWPPKPMLKGKISNMVRCLDLPSASWNIFPCYVKATAESYSEMLSKAKEAEIASCLSSDDEDFQVLKTLNRFKRHPSLSLPSPPMKVRRTEISRVGK